MTNDGGGQSHDAGGPPGEIERRRFELEQGSVKDAD
jgi:hypothetical protein